MSFIGIAINIWRDTKGTGGGSFNPIAALLSLSPTYLFVHKMANLAQNSDGTSPVTASGQTVAWDLDLTGNGNTITQLVAAAEPTYTNAAGFEYLVGDGVDDTLFIRFGASIAQPFTRMIAARILTAGVASGNTIMGSDLLNTGALFYTNTNFNSFSGAILTGPAVSVNTDVVWTGEFNGVNSTIQIDNDSVTTGDAGANAEEGVQLFFGNGSGFSNSRISVAVGFPRILSASEKALAKRAMASFQGRSL